MKFGFNSARVNHELIINKFKKHKTMEIIEKKETVYKCKFKTKNVEQTITFNHDDVPFNFHLDLNGCVTDIEDLKILYKFLGDVISKH